MLRKRKRRSNPSPAYLQGFSGILAGFALLDLSPGICQHILWITPAYSVVL